MLSRKSKDKTSKTGLAGKYIKKDTLNPEIKRKNCRNNLMEKSQWQFPFSYKCLVKWAEEHKA